MSRKMKNPMQFLRCTTLCTALALVPIALADTWTVDAGVRSLNLTSTATFQLTDGTYRHYYHGNGYRTSPDGLTLSDNKPLPGLKTPDGFFDRNPAITYDSQGWVMLMERIAVTAQNTVVGLFRATSSDGLTWTPETTAVMTPNAEEAGFISVPELFIVDANTWRIYYVVKGDVVSSATTTDRGKTWTREGKITLNGIATGQRFVDPEIVPDARRPPPHVPLRRCRPHHQWHRQPEPLRRRVRRWTHLSS